MKATFSHLRAYILCSMCSYVELGACCLEVSKLHFLTRHNCHPGNQDHLPHLLVNTTMPVTSSFHSFLPSPATSALAFFPFSSVINNMLAFLYQLFRKVEFLIEFSIIIALMLYSIYAPIQRREDQRRKSFEDRANLLSTSTTPL